MSAVCVIPAKGSSRRILGKNTRLFHGKPIIAYSIAAAKASGLFSRIVVSTDDDQVSRIAEGYGAQTFVRDASLCADSVGTQEVTADVLRWLTEEGDAPEYACCVYPCAPMILSDDLLDARDLLMTTNGDFVYPYAYADETAADPGMFYFGRTAAFLAGTPLGGPTTHRMGINQRRCIDINTIDDWLKAEAMYAELQRAA